MNWETILTYIVALVPSLAAVISVVVTGAKVFKSFRDLQKSVNEKVEMKELKESLEIALSENRQLKKLLIAELETKTRIKGGGQE